MIAPVKVQRLHANESGLSRFDTFEIEREMAQLPRPRSHFPCRLRHQRCGSFCSSCQPVGAASVTERQPAKSSSVWPEAFVSPGCRRCRNCQCRGYLAHGGHDRKRPHDGGHLAGTLRSGSDPVAR
jgi:hypothetical protein